jgi:hypothetical protein
VPSATNENRQENQVIRSATNSTRRSLPRAGKPRGRESGRPGGGIAIARAYALSPRSPPYRSSRPHPRPVTLDFRALDFATVLTEWPHSATDLAPIRFQRRGDADHEILATATEGI